MRKYPRLLESFTWESNKITFCRCEFSWSHACLVAGSLWGTWVHPRACHIWSLEVINHLIFAWFPYDLQELTSYIYFIHPPKYMQIEWVHQFDFVSKQNGHYFCMHRLADKRTQWLTLFREWFCNSETNRHGIYTRLRQRVRCIMG